MECSWDGDVPERVCYNFQVRINIKQLIIYYTPVILWALLIFIFSSQTVLASLSLSVPDFIFKKTAHMFVFGVLYFLLFRALVNTFDQKHSKIFWLLAFSFCLLYAISDEYHQSFTPGRHPSLRDIGYDSLGMFIAFTRIYHYI